MTALGCFAMPLPVRMRHGHRALVVALQEIGSFEEIEGTSTKRKHRKPAKEQP